MSVKKQTFTIWLIGVPGAGKTTLANALSERLLGAATVIDSDKVREKHFDNPDWSTTERSTVYEKIWAINKNLRKSGSAIISASGGAVDLDFYNDSMDHVYFIIVKCPLNIAALRQSNNLYLDNPSLKNIRLPALISLDISSTEDVKYLHQNNIPHYAIIPPKNVALVLENGKYSNLEENISLILDFLTKQGLQ